MATKSSRKYNIPIGAFCSHSRMRKVFCKSEVPHEYESQRNKKDEEDLLSKVDEAGILGYKLPKSPNDSPDCIRFLLASYRLCTRQVLIEREPYVLVRRIDK